MKNMCKIYLAGPVVRFKVFKESAPGGEQLNKASSQQQRLEEFQTFFEWLCFSLMTKICAADTMDSKKIIIKANTFIKSEIDINTWMSMM